MARKKIVWTKTAATQRRLILEYWLQRNQSNAYPLKLLQLSNAKIKSIAQSPTAYKKADFPDTHVASMGHFSIYYKFTTDTIFITAFWDNRQDPGQLIQLLNRT